MKAKHCSGRLDKSQWIKEINAVEAIKYTVDRGKKERTEQGSDAYYLHWAFAVGTHKGKGQCVSVAYVRNGEITNG